MITDRENHTPGGNVPASADGGVRAFSESAGSVGDRGNGTRREPLASVIVPTFNYGRHLKECIGSVLGQTHRNVQVVVVDDGSTDDTRARMAEFAGDSRVVYLPQSRGGISKARNTGIKASAGEFIAFLDADDYWPHADQLAISIQWLQAHSDFGWVFGDAQPFDEKGFKGGPYLKQSGYYTAESAEPVPFEVTPALLCKEGFFLPTGTICARRSCFEQAGLFDESLKMFEDIDMWLRMLDFRIAFAARSLLARREHGNNAGQSRLVSTGDLERLIVKHRLGDRGVNKGSLLRRAYYLEGKYHLSRGDGAAARQAFARSMRFGVGIRALGGYCGSLATSTFRKAPRAQQTSGSRA